MPALGERIYDHAVGPDVCLFAYVLLSGDDLRGHVVGGAADDGEFLLFVS